MNSTLCHVTLWWECFACYKSMCLKPSTAALLALAALLTPSLAYVQTRHRLRTRQHSAQTRRITPTAALPLILPLGPRITRRRRTRRAASALPVDPFSIAELDTVGALGLFILHGRREGCV